MRNNIALILLLMCECMLVTSRSLQDINAVITRPLRDTSSVPKPASSVNGHDQVISVRITSSVAVGRGRGRLKRIDNNLKSINYTNTAPPSVTEKLTSPIDTTWTTNTLTMPTEPTETPAPPVGANLEFIKQLNSKKEARGLANFERIHSFPSYFEDEQNDANDSVPEASVKSVFEIEKDDEIGQDENIDNVPLARSVPSGSAHNNFIQDLTRKPFSDRTNPKLTTVSFNIVHDTPKVISNYNTPSESYASSLSHTDSPLPKDDNHHKPARIYSEPAKIYSEPAKIYSEPAKIYGEPAKVYGVPAKVYSEPSKIYGEPSKFYSQPASLNLPPKSSYPPDVSRSPEMKASSTMATTRVTTASSSLGRRLHDSDHLPEKNYEVDEKVSVLSAGRSHGVQESSTERCQQRNCKVGYVVEGRQYRKYRVEEKTPDGFIVGEYGVVRNEDGALRGVRYTAHGDASPTLIYDALMKFLQLK